MRGSGGYLPMTEAEIDEHVLTVLRTNGGRMSTDHLLMVLHGSGIGQARLRKSLDRLVRQGLAEREQRGTSWPGRTAPIHWRAT